MVTRERIFTLDDLREVQQRPENADKRFELLRGGIYEVPTPSVLHALITAVIFNAIYNFATAHQLGYAFGDALSYVLPNGDELIPDVSFVSVERLPSPLPERFSIAPDLAVEVFSPSNRERAMTEKVESYLESGTRLVWVVYPKRRVIEVFRLNADGSLNLRKVDINGVIDGEDVLPGFTLPVKNVFPAEQA